jgi:hypothetical protein
MTIPPEVHEEVQQLFAADQSSDPSDRRGDQPGPSAGASLLPPKPPAPPPALVLSPEQIDAVRTALSAYRKRCHELHAEHLGHAARYGAQVTTYDDVLRVIGPPKDARP